MQTRSDTIKLLGIMLDSRITWEAHADLTANKISKNIFILRRLCHEVSRDTLVAAYYGLIHSNITYAILVCGHSCHLEKIFKEQRKCIRAIGGLSYRADCRS